jgi:hypothetical protein
MRSPWSVRVLLPAALALSEGSWLAVLYAALRAAGGDLAHLGPLELGALVMAGTAWSRRRGWRSPAADAIGLPVLVLLSGVFGWLLDPGVRVAVIDGSLVSALGLHLTGWVAALAFWRGSAHRSSEDDAVIEHRLVQWAVPTLAVPWLFGYAVASGQVEHDFAAAAFVGTLFFIGSTFAALGLARHEALRQSTGTEWAGDRSWLFLIMGLALVLTVLTIPVAALLGIPARSLLGTMVGPLQTLILIVVVVTAPIFLLAALIADLLRSTLPADFQLGELSLPSFNFSRPETNSDLPLIILTVIVAGAFLFDFIIFAAMIWFSARDRRRRSDFADPAFEEREIMVPPPSPAEAKPIVPPRVRGPAKADDATGAYLAALDALAVDGRWPRKAHETPAAHLARARAEGLDGPSFGRLTAAYQLARYRAQPLPSQEQRRARSRLQALLSLLRLSERS